jgi:ferredoxin-NADP reductase
MYRLILYYLGALIVIAAVLGFLGILPYNPVTILFSAAFLLTVSWIINTIFARVYGVTPNTESFFITSLILSLILTPPKTPHEIPVLFWAAVLSMASKYILAANKKHIFNPVALAVYLTGVVVNGPASWWIGNTSMLVPVVLGGILIVRKLRRADLVNSFFIAAVTALSVFSLLNNGNLLTTLEKALLYSPIFFFAFVMLTEPLTTPPTRFRRIIYGSFTGLLFAPQFHIGSFYTTPEIALLLGNLVSYLLSPKVRYILRLTNKIKLTPDTYEFLFIPDKRLVFNPGQYLEWTLGHHSVDARGNRRYFTIASAPEEDHVRLGISLQKGDTITASQLSGDFTLPKNSHTKLVFIAGGIGITPFRSMIEHLLEKDERRSITLFYANKKFEDIVYYDVFRRAKEKLGITTIYTLTGTDNLPKNWRGEMGRINADMIIRYVPDYRERIFYLSGPHNMVESYREVLKSMGVPENQIKTDYFPGFA